MILLELSVSYEQSLREAIDSDKVCLFGDWFIKYIECEISYWLKRNVTQAQLKHNSNGKSESPNFSKELIQ